MAEASSIKIILKASNWAPWHAQTIAHLNLLGVMEVIDPGWAEPMPANTQAGRSLEERKEWREWNKAQGMALGVIQETVDEANRQLIKGQGAKDAMSTLEATHNVKDTAAQFLLLSELRSTTQAPQESLSTFYGRVETAG